ncbi:protease S8 tripeptidyl peptidase I [Microdochium bolleyi]|uniref:tripeptidyl-peptidase II n=1 Tax=Microdochium bolleyi TaxID=196109 RepID=A0A136IKD2_9PEZI|nr:protease S8 tripeptidyl peptidase I [Microdochium bolleyi]
MSLTLLSCLVAALSGTASALPPSARHVVHEERGSVLKDWVRGARIEKTAILPVRIGLAQTNLDRGHDMLMDVTSPKSSKYSQWWSQEDLHEFFAPSTETVNTVKAWLTSSGIHGDRIVHSDNKGWLAFDATTEEVERLMLAEFHEYEHAATSNLRVGTDKYHIPEHLVEHIDLITPGIKLTPVKRSKIQKKSVMPRHSSHQIGGAGKVFEGENPFGGSPFWGHPSAEACKLPPALQNCTTNMTAPCYRKLYQLPEHPVAVPGNSLGLYEQGDFIDKPDLDKYNAVFAPHVPQGTYPIPALIDGAQYDFPPNASDYVGGEALIDVDLATSLIYPQTVTLYQVDDNIYALQDLKTTNLFNTFLDALDGSYCTYEAFGEKGNDPKIDPVYPNPAPGGYKGKLQCGVYKPTKVISASYGQAENDLPANYQKRQCNEFLKLGLMGTSVLVASGDYGVASFAGDGSKNGCLGPESTIFNPQYPSNCPYVTSVGGTMLYPSQTILDHESVMHVNLSSSAQNFSSAGGFSNIYPVPDFQKATIDQYFRKHNPPYQSYSEFNPDFKTVKGLYNRIGRAYPDVSANGASFASFLNGKVVHFYGSSLASPLFASVLTLLNQDRARVGKRSIGFVNPVLYAHPEVLNDITNGTNVGCGSDGFKAVSGWDPATGLGTPNYPKMRELFMALP